MKNEDNTDFEAKSTTLSNEEANALVIEHREWAESIAKSVARAWGLDWQGDELDGAAMEALIFCSRRFSPDKGVPFRGYARRRIHEASTEAAKSSKGWRKSGESTTQITRLAREVSVELFNIFPELHSGQLPLGNGDTNSDIEARMALQRLLVGASIIATKQGIDAALPDDALDFKRMIEAISILEEIHQTLLWKVYWEGLSLRNLATEWDTDELNVIREHKVLLDYLQKSFGKGTRSQIPRIRPGLRDTANKLKNQNSIINFKTVLQKEQNNATRI